MTPARKEEIRAMLDAATPGPWQWFGNTKVHSLYLATVHHGRRFVMQFARWGMSSAQPRFQVNGIMEDGKTLVRYERTYRADVDGIDHPDARLIEQAPTLIRELLAALEEAEATIANERGEGAPPSGGWEWTIGSDLRGTWWRPGGFRVERLATAKWYWHGAIDGFRPDRVHETARAAMIAANKMDPRDDGTGF